MPQEEESTIEPCGCYCLTLNIVDRVDIFIKPVFKQVIVQSLNYFIEKKGLIVYGWCLMTNHLHLVVQARRGFDLFVIINDLKTFTAKIILEDIDAESEVRRNWIVEKFKEAALFSHLQVWQTSDHPVRINLEKNSIDEYLQYIHDNPVRNKIVTASQDYLYSSARNYIGSKGLVNIELSDQLNETGFMLHHIPTYKYFPQNITE